MWKKGVITDEISQDLEVAAAMAQEFRLDGLELRSVWEKGPHEWSEAEVAKIKEIAASHELEVVALSSPFYKCALGNATEIGEHLALLERTISVAQSLGARFIRGFTFWTQGNYHEAIPKIVAAYAQPVAMLRGTGITLVIENEPSTYAGNGRKVAEIVRAIAAPEVRAVWDPGNDIYDPEQEVPFPDGYQQIKEFMVHMHLKDARRHPQTKKPEGMPIGAGEVDYIGQFRQLQADGYQGYICLETHWRPAQELPEELLAMPKGSGFSYLGDVASRECLKRWQQLLEEL